ncbi:MAG: NfeD family protein [Gammaproteobacteria bacterium]|jgi:membrane protein implicated in regulation of membrane protease activity
MISDYIVSHQTEFWLMFGFIMLALEVVTGFTTGVFLFGGLGALTTGLLMSFGMLPVTWIAGVSCTGISSGIATLLLWKPLKKLQGDRPAGKDNSSDLVGHEFVVDSDIAINKPGATKYSGITWKVEIDKEAGVDTIEAGQRVSVTSVEVGVFKVKLSQ